MVTGDSDNSNSDKTGNIDWSRELKVAIVGGVVGALVFTAISPFIVPTIRDVQVNHLNAQNPVLGVEVEYAADVPGNSFSVPENDTYDRYRVIVNNPSNRALNIVTVVLAFPGGIEAQEVGHFQAPDDNSYSESARLTQYDSFNNTTLVTNAISTPRLPPGKTISATFLIDRSPEEIPIPGYWETGGLDDYNGSKGSLMISGQFNWEFKGRIYSEQTGFKFVNGSNREYPNKFDLCVGDKRKNIC